ncbi:MAG: hypothetical protein QF662_06525, partial [Phycisphaerae bacterium]|nr:hypothetical protein [Phycisphaerae bacterium]
MTTVENNKAKDSPAANAWYRVAVGTSIVAGALSLIVCAALVSNYFHLKNADVLDSEELLKLKEAVAKNPDDVAAKERFRGLDLRLRKEYFRRMDFAGTGAYLLTAFAICFVVAIKSAFTFRRKLPMPQGGAGEPEEQARAATMARWSVAVVGVVLGGAAVFLAMGPIGEAPEETPGQVQPRPTLATVGAFPSEEEISRNWPRFRGPGGLGVSAYTNIPTEWDGKTGKGILWKTPVPLPGKNSPVL